MPPSANPFYPARILERRDISEDLWIIRIDPGGEFHFLPGQYATIGVVLPDKHHERPYSIVSAPHEKFVEFFLELVPHGEVTPMLHACQVGDEVTLRKTAKGTLSFDASSGRTNHLLLATVTGVCPYVSYIRSLREQWNGANYDGRHRLFLIQGASRSSEFGYREELTRIAEEVPWLTYIPTVSRPWEDKAWTAETGRVDDVVRKYADSWGLKPSDTTVYLVGHPGMIENVEYIVTRRGWNHDAIKKEAFFVAGHEAAAPND